MKIREGQFYSVSVFDLGFINIYPFDILVHVDRADYGKDLLVLSPRPVPDIPAAKHFYLVENWFQTVYPGIAKAKCILKSISTFEPLINLYYARLEQLDS